MAKQIRIPDGGLLVTFNPKTGGNLSAVSDPTNTLAEGLYASGNRAICAENESKDPCITADNSGTGSAIVASSGAGAAIVATNDGTIEVCDFKGSIKVSLDLNLGRNLNVNSGDLNLGHNLNVNSGDFNLTGKLNQTGDFNLTGNLNVSKGGDIILNNADIAEDFSVADHHSVFPGCVMTFDENGAVEVCNKEYDKKAAGVISGAGNYKPGLILDRNEITKTRMPIALMGKVFCMVDADMGAIEVGDLLTTSSTKGHAMKAQDPFKAFGAVIGKALKPLREGKGLVPILVALQ